MIALAYIAAGVLFAIALAHTLWGLRIYWPASSEFELARTVVERNQIKRMPSPAACFAAAAVFLAMAIWPLWQTGLLTSPLSDVMTLALGWGWFIGLGVRGGVGYARDWRRLMSEEPFATRDRWLYSPLCLALAVMFFVLLKSGMSR